MNSQLLLSRESDQIVLFTLTDVEDIKTSRNRILGNKKMFSEILYEGELNKPQTIKEISKFVKDLTQLSFANNITYIFIVAEKTNPTYEPEIKDVDDSNNSRTRKNWTREEEALLLSDDPEVVAKVIERSVESVKQKIRVLKLNQPHYYRQLLKNAGEYYTNPSINATDKVIWKENEDIILFIFPETRSAAKLLNVDLQKCFNRISYLKYNKKDLYKRFSEHGNILKSVSNIKEKLKLAAEFLEGKKDNSELLTKYYNLADNYLNMNNKENNSTINNQPVYTLPSQPQISQPQTSQHSQQQTIENHNSTEFKQKVSEEIVVVEQPIFQSFVFTFNDFKVVFKKQPSSIRIEGNTLYID